MDYGLIAEKLGHSFSAEIHALIGDYDYRLCELTNDVLDAFMLVRDFKGINVTIPYKKSVIPYLHEMSDIARRIGSVNTIVNRDGKLYGYNTDYYGMRDMILQSGIDLSGKTVLILGTGGTSVTARVVAEDLGAKDILVVSRRPADGVITYSDAENNYSHAEIIINTTPVGMYPDNYCETKTVPIDLSKFTALEGFVDAVYNPLCTVLGMKAAELGAKAVGGLYMLVAQAVRASEIFRDVEIPKIEIDRIYTEVLKMKQSIALTGMPACGKSTIGKLIAKMLDREFIDTDAEIVKRAGMPITEIFATKGDKAFRDLETEVIKDVSKRSGIVIATGGGAILRDENVAALKQNCKVYFLDRPLEWLTPTSDRPTASDKESIKKRYEERYDRYISTADVVIKPTEDVENNAKMIIERF